ncbi:MAG TPA: hypothetical protein VIV35_00680, partial [Chitinophagaceae bacterium]
ACNNSKKDKAATENDQPVTTTNSSVQTINNATERNSGTKFSIEGKEISVGGSLLVQKDKKKLKPGNDYLVMLTANDGPANEGLILNFLMDLKPGTYPVVGMSMSRGPSGEGELYGGIMGGEERITDYKVNITECKDLGSNNTGGHKWSISGTFDDMTIPAMGIMLMDKTKNHPKEIKVEKGSFYNLTFDDNWEEMMEKAMELMKKKNN